MAIALGASIPSNFWWVFISGVFSVCLIASANYTINEYLDAEFDRFHPLKKDRPAVVGKIRGGLVYVQWMVLAIIGLAIYYTIKIEFFAANALLLFMGIVYNVKPFRTKDRICIDVISEAINNPLRFLLGWYLVDTIIIPPSSVLLSYWMGGAFLMAVKRFAEYRFIDDPDRAALYRRSFRSYTEEKLLLSSFFYAITSAVFLGVFLVKYKIEFLLLLPFFSVLFVWYLHIGFQTNSASQAPQKLYEQGTFMIFILILGLASIGLFFVNIPILTFLVEVN